MIKGACLLTKNRSLISVADVVAFHSRDTKDLPSPEDRKTHQVYLYWNMESPANAGGFKFPAFYLKLSAHFSMESFSGQALPMPSKDFFLMKNESIFGLISNCRNGSNERGNLVQLITNLYPVDLYGKCAWEKKNKDFCTRKLGCSKELREAVEKRLFHLVLENTDCLGYVTEKTFDRIGYDSIPIGIRRDAYEKAGLPVGAFIFLDDFESPQMFVDHLRYLESNETAYIEYFQWRNEYLPHPLPPISPTGPDWEEHPGAQGRPGRIPFTHHF
ncbi:unnamed protein product, partial [Mesorhabditis belari]|uniref:Fucosyltransferase n=1 Tax=Mesorhabditis belari TaxID=2138241 RepID=A0AAF3EQY3_9BILA